MEFDEEAPEGFYFTYAVEFRQHWQEDWGGGRVTLTDSVGNPFSAWSARAYADALNKKWEWAETEVARVLRRPVGDWVVVPPKES